MSAILLKSYTAEIFLSLSILAQLIFNIRFIHNKKYNFPEITFETFCQSFFVLVITFILMNKSDIQGSFFGSFLNQDESLKELKLCLLFFSILGLPVLYKSVKFQKINFFEFWSLFLLSIFALLLMINANNLLSFYILMEMQALCSYILASFRKNSIFSAEAGLKYFIAGSFISGFYLLGTSIIYGCLGTLDLSQIYLLRWFPLSNYATLVSFVFYIGLSLVFVTLLFKIACFPFHFWAPEVYEGSPISSTFIFSILPKISLFSFFIKLINVFIAPDLANSQILLDVFLFCAWISTIYCTALAITQTSIKRLIIYSSLAQTGFLVAGIVLAGPTAYGTTFFFLSVYLITSILIWSYIIIFYEASAIVANFFNQEIKPLYITAFSNFYKYNARFAFPLVIILFSIGGIPPFAGFLTKMLILYELVNDNYWLYALLFLCASVVSVYYYFRLLKIAFFEANISHKASYHFFQSSGKYSDINIVIILFLTFSLVYFFFCPTALAFYCQYITLL